MTRTSSTVPPTEWWRRDVRTPIGPLCVIAGAAGVRAILWPDDRERRVPGLAGTPTGEHLMLDAAARQLTEYFDGERTAFELDLDLRGTPFQCRVWRAVADIPFGQASTYGDIAARIGSPRAVRAVGAANARNPISIVVPCHRVLGANGKLIGLAGGLETKRRLLDFEGSARGERSC